MHSSSPLAAVLTLPHIPHRNASLRSISSAASPRTPRSCGSPSTSIFFPQSTNRKSTDSWNSSTADEFEWEWKPEQVLLLSRTLDALPAHLVTPFNGPIPPSNLLDKIARGISQAKGPVEWPHSLRATRVKLIELSRSRAKEQAAIDSRHESIAEEPEAAVDTTSNYYYTQDRLEKPLPGPKRPLYRQSSMDFILNAVEPDVKNNDEIAILSNRLQCAERYATHRHCVSPPSSTAPSLLSPSTPSTSTLNTLSSFPSQRFGLRRTVSSVSSSSLSIMSSSSDGILPNPRVQRLMQDDGYAPIPPPKDGKLGSKRAPSFGALAQEARREYIARSPDNHSRKNSFTCPSSDEEEKTRNVQAKKARKHSVSSVSSPPDSPASTTSDCPPTMRRGAARLKEAVIRGLRSSREGKAEVRERGKKEASRSIEQDKVSSKPRPMNLQRNPSMFGPELSKLPSPPPPSITPSEAVHPQSAVVTRAAPKPLNFLPGADSNLPISSRHLNKAPLLNSAADVNTSPVNSRLKTLRRVRRLGPARRISFSSLVPTGDEADADGEGESEEKGGLFELGTAFQLH